MTPPFKAENPFVGLRPFNSEDSLYYFGRNEQSKALLQQLHASRFLAVVGGSGSGKSSLVRAGLIPILESGFLVQDRDTWQFATMKPGATPLANLAEALLGVTGESAAGDEEEDFEDRIRIRGVAAILEEVQPVLKTRQTNLLILVDQFEELFRFADNLDVREEAADFVNLLLRLSGQPETGIYIVVTMRSDFIGDCDRFQGLPEAMNRSQYLVPRMTRQQRREAIAGPVRLSRGTTAPRLLDKLLNVNIDTRDDLPILQHALMRTWENWAADGGEGPMDLEHLEAAGGIREALNNHADEALSELNEEERPVARRLFKSLTETDSGNRKIRRPAYLSEIAAITEASPERIEGVIDKFCGQGRSFLVRVQKPGQSDILVDISHESLIRQWDRLRNWVEDEAEAAKTYRRLAETAELHDSDRADIYRGIDLDVALEWKADYQPTRVWGMRYHPGYDSALAFLDRSQQAHEAELTRLARIRKRKVQTILATAATATVLLSMIAVSSWRQKKIAQEQTRTANYELAKVIEGKAVTALGNVDGGRSATHEYQEAWRSALDSLNQQNLPEEANFPGSMGMLCRWDLAVGAMANLWTASTGDSPLRCAVFHPDGNYFVSGSESGELALWHHPFSDEAPLKVEVPAFTASPGKTYTLAFNPAGTVLATGSGRNVRLWEFSDPENPRQLDPLKGPEVEGDADVRGLAFSPDGNLLAVGAEDHSIRLWDLSDPGTPRKLGFDGAHEGVVYTVAFSPDGRFLASGSEDKSILLWDLSRLDSPEPLEIPEGHRDSVASVAFSPDGRTLASGSRDRSLRMWDLSDPLNPAELAHIENSHSESISQIVFNADGTGLATASYDTTIGIWDLSDPHAPQQRRKFQGHRSEAYGAAFSPDGSTLLSASKDSTVRLWDLNDPGKQQKSTGHSDFVNSLAIRPGGGILVSGARDNTRLWELNPQGAPRELTALSGHRDYVYCVAISPDGKFLASGSRDTDICLFSLEDPGSPKLLATLIGDESGTDSHSSWVLALAFSADSQTLASGSHDKTLRLWDLTDPEKPTQAAVVKEFESLVSTVAFSPEGMHLAAGSYDGSIHLYDFSDPELPRELSVLTLPAPVTCLSFRSPDGRLLGAGSHDGSIRLWDLADASAPREIALPMKHEGPVTSAAFSPDGDTLASGSVDKTIRLWDLANPESPGELAVLRGHTESVSSVVFSPDGGTLYSGSRDHTIRLWKLAGPFNDYRRAGSEAPSFKVLSSELPDPFPWRPPDLHPIKWMLDSAAD